MISKITPQTLDHYWSTLVFLHKLSMSFNCVARIDGFHSKVESPRNDLMPTLTKRHKFKAVKWFDRFDQFDLLREVFLISSLRRAEKNGRRRNNWKLYLRKIEAKIDLLLAVTLPRIHFAKTTNCLHSSICKRRKQEIGP